MPETTNARVNSGYGSHSIPIDVSSADANVSGCISLFVTTGGDVHMVFENGLEDTWTVPDGTYIRLMVKTVKTGSTDATGIKAIY